MSVKVIDKRVITDQDAEGNKYEFLEFTIKVNDRIEMYRIPADWDKEAAERTLHSYLDELRKKSDPAETRHQWMNEL